MKIKKILLLGLVAASLLASCKKNNDNNTAAGLGFKAITENNNGDSRTYLDGIDVKWMEGDVIRVANADGAQQVFDLAGGATTMNGDFYDANVEESFYEPDYVALYPATNAADVANTIDEDGIATFTLPETQTITATGTFANKSMPMVAHSGTETLPFKNVLGGLVIPLVGDGLHVSKVVLTSLETTDKLWGVYTADCNSDDPVPTYVSGGNHQLTLSCDVTLDPATANDFIFMVPPRTLSKGFKVEVYDGTDFLYEKTADWSATPNATFIPRSVLMKVDHNLEVVPPTPVDLVVTTISPTFISTNSAWGLGMVDNVPGACGILYIKAANLTDSNNPELDLVVDSQNPNVVNLPSTPGVRFDAGLPGAGHPDLELNTIYYVRAWASNVLGVKYGVAIPFATRRDYFALGPNQGKMANENGPYQFSVSATKKVAFSMGNLQYQASTNTWRFAEYQFEYVGGTGYYDGLIAGNVYANGEHPDASQNGVKSSNNDRGETYDQWIDLFQFGTSGYRHGAVHPEPWATAKKEHLFPYGRHTNPLDARTGKADWGYNKISNGLNQEHKWHVLQGRENDYNMNNHTEEVYYLIYSRPLTNTPYRFKRAGLVVRGTSADEVSTVNHYPACGYVVNGLLIFPDTFAWPSLVGTITSSSWKYNQLTEAQWSLLEQQGVVFLPAAGHGVNALSMDYVNANNSAFYHTSSWCGLGIDNPGGVYFEFGDNKLYPAGRRDLYFSYRHSSVRLVNDDVN